MESCVVNGIRVVMLHKGLLQKFVAERAGFTEQQFSDMLNGRKVIRAEYLPAIARALSVRITDLYDPTQVADQDSA